MSKNILVTGGAGYIGSHVVKQLMNSGYNAIVYDNLSTGHKEFTERATFVNGDIGDKELLNKVLTENKVEAVIHFAANADVGESIINPMKYYANNIVNGLNLLNTMIVCNIKKIVFSSSCAIYGIPAMLPIVEEEKQMPVNTYGYTKLMFEQIMMDYQSAYVLQFVSLRYFNAAGADIQGELGEWHEPETHVIPLIIQTALGMRKQFSIFGTDYDTKDGTCIRDYIHVTDLADAHVKALNYLFENEKSNIFNLGTGTGISVSDLVNTVEKITNKRLNIVEEKRRSGDPPILVANNEKSREILKWQPVNSSIENIIKTAWNWHCKYGRFGKE
jgi:UDP-glucose 4-epimerase